MNVLAVLLAVTVVATEKDAVPDVRALLVTHLEFTDKDRAKLADTVIKLLASCGSSCPSTEKDFESIHRQCHLHVKFAKPQEVTVTRTEKVKVDELVVSFPTNTGGIWVRIGTDYRYYTKFDYEQCKAVHELLKAGKPQ
jgi:hypothetical protein